MEKICKFQKIVCKSPLFYYAEFVVIHVFAAFCSADFNFMHIEVDTA